MSQTEATPRVDIATFTVDGEEMKAPKGANLLQTLLDAGKEVPHYCYHPSLSIDGSCRLCFIQLEGDPRVHVSCNMKVADGLKIQTRTQTVLDARKGMMEFLLVNHPLDCPICDKGGECMLQRYSMDHGLGDARTVDDRRRYEKPQFDPLIDLERNRCILCSRCVRFCDEIGEKHVMGIVGRGDQDKIATFGNGPIDTVFSGNVIDICPVGALTSKPFRFTARSWELQQAVSTCTYCSAGCGLTAWIRDGKVMRCTTPVKRKGEDYELNEDTTEFICNMGRFGNDYAASPDRLMAPAFRRDGAMIKTSWEEALATVAGSLQGIAEKYGPDSVAFLAGPRATNEELYLLQRIARQAVGTNNVDWRAHLADEAACLAHSAALAGADGTLDDLEEVDVVLVVEADFLASVPVLALKLKEAARNRKNKTVLLGSVGDEGFLSRHASAQVLCKSRDAASALDALAGGGSAPAGVDLSALAEILAKAGSGLIVFGIAGNAGRSLPSLVSAAHRLRRKLGPAWKTLPVDFSRNGVGAAALGAQPDRLPGAAFGDERRQGRISELWNSELPSVKGLTAPEILRAAAAGQIKGLYILGQDALRLAPDQELLAEALAKVEFLAVQDVLPGVATPEAHVILPGAAFTEKEASFLDLEGRFSCLTKAGEPAGDCGDDVAILVALGRALGLEIHYADAEAVFGEFLPLLGVEKSFRYFDLRLDGPGPEWPLRPRIYYRQKTRPTFRVRFAEPASSVSGNGGATPGNGIAPCGAWDVTRADHLGDRSAAMNIPAVRPEPELQLNPTTASRLGLSPGAKVTVRAGGGEPVVMRLRLSGGIVPDTARFPANDFPGWVAAESLDISPA